ncbi:hypothetical protein BGZ46_003858 [Entomortierella lignicola]|nr:hypothetical protein BGZ46_003858 [Entomortierella lignicola]
MANTSHPSHSNSSLPSNSISTSRILSSLLFIFALSTPFLSSTVSAQSSPTTTPRHGHTATLLNDTVYFVGGIGAASSNDTSMTTPIKTISSLNLTSLQFTEIPTSLVVYNHAATSGQVASSSFSNFYKIGISFGQTSSNNPANSLQWLDPLSGIATDNDYNNKTSTKGVKNLVGRIGHSMVQFGNNLWDFGGHPLGNTAVSISDTPTFDLTDMVWYNQTSGLARYGHASAAAGIDRIVTCYGISLNAVLNADCVYFSVSSRSYSPANLTWTNAADTITGGLVGHTIVTGIVNPNLLYMFGGSSINGSTFSKDVYILDTTKLPSITITKIVQPSTNFSAAVVPSPRSEHAAVAVGMQVGFMIVHGGRTTSNGTRTVLADATPYIFSMDDEMWVDNATFIEKYSSQKIAQSTGVVVIIIGIMAGVIVLGIGVFYYIWKGIRDDERERSKQEAEAARSSTISTMEDDYDQRKSGVPERKINSVYPLAKEDVSLSSGPFKSTTSLIQSDEYGRKPNKKKFNQDYDPYSPGGTTLNENGSMNGYYSTTTSSSNPSKLHKNNSNGSSQYSRQGQDARVPPSTASGSERGEGDQNGTAPDDSYYNSRDLYLDKHGHDDDDSSITDSTTSAWTNPMELAPPNPRFSRGAISQAHRQLVGAISTSNNTPGNRYSSGWDTGSPGGSLSSQDGDQRRSGNSMQMGVIRSFRPKYSSRVLVIRNASMYSNNRTSVMQSNPINYVTNNSGRVSMYGGSSTSDTNTEDSGSYYSGPGGKQISAALAARQQRRSMRYSQDSQASSSAKIPQQSQQQQQQSESSTGEDPMLTKVLPIITTKITKPTMAKVVNNSHQRGSKAMASTGSFGSAFEQEDTMGGLGIDFSRFGDGGNSNSGGTSKRTSFNGGMSYQGRRGSSTLNPSYNKYGNNNNNNSNNSNNSTTSGTATKRESRLASSFTANSSGRDQQKGGGNGGAATDVVLKMPPQGRQNISQPISLRESIIELGHDMPGFLNYGDN